MTKSYDNAVSVNNAFLAGKNKIINGDFRINQRGFSSTTTNNTYGFDRWVFLTEGDGTATYSAQTFTTGSAPVSGYEAINFARVVTSGQSSSAVFTRLVQRVEDVRTLSGQTVTVSFWAKAASGTPKVAVEVGQNFGSGGSSDVNTYAGQVTLSTTWERYSVSVSVPSILGKTIGADSHMRPVFYASAGSNFNARTNSLGVQNNTFDFWGVQLEAGSVATPFTTATGTLAGELAACQRYFQILGGDNVYEYFCIGSSTTTTDASGAIPLKVTMRSTPTLTFTTASNYRVTQGVTANTATVVQGDILTKNTINVQFTVASGLTAGNANRMIANNTTSATISISSEL